MKIIRNVLSENLLSDCIDELRSELTEESWRTNLLNWDSTLFRGGINGSCLARHASSDIRSRVVNEIKKYVPQSDRIEVAFYCWQPQSGIALHNDGDKVFGATIYLNYEWDVNDGGLFVWWSLESGKWEVAVPEQNVMIINDSAEDHMVTSVSPSPSDFRYSLQIWGLRGL